MQADKHAAGAGPAAGCTGCAQAAAQHTAEEGKPPLPVQQPTFAERVDGINHIKARHHLACMPCQSGP